MAMEYMCRVALNVCSWRQSRQHLGCRVDIWNRRRVWGLGGGGGVESCLLPWPGCCLGAVIHPTPNMQTSLCIPLTPS